MAEILKFACVMIIFLSSFIVSQNIDGNFLFFLSF